MNKLISASKIKGLRLLKTWMEIIFLTLLYTATSLNPNFYKTSSLRFLLGRASL